MASVRKHATRDCFQIRFYLDGSRKTWYVAIGDNTPKGIKSAEKIATQIGMYLDDLAHAKSTGERPKAETKAWVASLDSPNRSKLVGYGLAEPHSEKLATDAGKFLGAFIDSYLDSRTDAKPTTITNYKQTRRLLVEQFGERKPLVSITPADCEKWRRWMLGDKKLAQPTVAKHVKRAKTMFAEAVADRLLESSPIAGVKAGSDIGGQKHHVDADSSKLILDKCPDAQWRCVFALARWGGLRRDCEIQTLKWTDIDWATERINIDSVKTGFRQCPLFPELMGVLRDASELAPKGSVYVVGRLASYANLGAGLATIVKRAGVKPWPKMFNALRATRRTELQKLHPGHVVNAWLGQSTQTANNYYLQVTDADWEAATKVCSPICSPVTVPSRDIRKDSTNHQGNKKPSKTHAIDGSRGLLIVSEVTPMGLNGNCDFPRESGTESGDCGDVVAPFVAPSSTDSMLQAVIDAWEQMTDAEKSLCYSMACHALGKPLFGRQD